jgi:hypothetical protein
MGVSGDSQVLNSDYDYELKPCIPAMKVIIECIQKDTSVVKRSL